MPTVTRFLVRLFLLAAFVGGAIYGLANFVSPKLRTISEPVDTKTVRDLGQPAG